MGLVLYNFLHLTVLEFLAALHIVYQGAGEQEKVFSREAVFRHLNMEEGEVVHGGSDRSQGK